MGDLIGGIIGGVGSLIGGGTQRKADKAGAQQALTGYNYLTGQNGVGDFVSQGQSANAAGRGITDQAAGILTGNNPSAMANYLKSTGYNFQRDQGTSAIAGNAAARGILNSGATAKALTKFGTGLAGQNFNNYLANLGGVAGQYGNIAGRGLQASGQIGAAGTAGGASAGNLTAAGGAAVGGADAAFGGATQAAGGGNFLAGIGNAIGNFF